MDLFFYSFSSLRNSFSYFKLVVVLRCWFVLHHVLQSLSLLDRIEADCYITGELDIVAEKVHLLTQADELSPELETKVGEIQAVFLLTQ